MPTNLQRQAEEFAAATLDCDRGPFPRSGKVIHDAVWGTIDLAPHEVALLDTSLLQRLRYLHQTGFAFLTFPSARHTRFEHSLGVLRQTDSHLQALKKRFPHHVTEETVASLRLAALLHDCSHGMFSHTSEGIYRFLPDMKEYVGPSMKFHGHSPSELIARFILESPRFQEVLDFLARQKIPIHSSGHDLARYICGDFLKTTEPHELWKVDVINGPLDADKLDYVARDGLHTGLPLPVDLERLWLSTEIQFVQKGLFPWIDRDQTRLVINRSGVSAVEEIVFARFQLTNAVYNHPKIRACDCLFKSWVEEQQKEKRFLNTMDFVLATDMDFLFHKERLNRSQLPKRVITLSARTLSGPDGPPLPDEFTNLVDESNATREGAARTREIARKVADAAKIPGNEQHLVWLDLPPLPKLGGLEYALVNQGTRNKPAFLKLEDVFPIISWRKMYAEKKWRGHVFAPPRYTGQVAQCVKDVLESEIPGLKINQEAWLESKQTAPRGL